MIGEELCLTRTVLVEFMREKLPYKNYTPKSGTINGAIIGILLMVEVKTIYI